VLSESTGHDYGPDRQELTTRPDLKDGIDLSAATPGDWFQAGKDQHGPNVR
jgi:hypothetical protein